MIPSQLQPLANHVWQSTLFAAIASLLVLALRRNQAHIRYCLWLAASVKFCLPFSLLVIAGSYFAPHTAREIAPSVVSPAAEQVTRSVFASVFPETTPASMPPPAFGFLAVWCVIWAVGLAIVVSSWWRRLRQIRAALLTAAPVRLLDGIPIMSSPSFIEPGVFDIRQPILLMPDGVASQLTTPQLQAVLAHELCHVRRRDNLAAAIHMVVEALFWFHPLVWWLGARLMEERERACDEDVLRMGNAPEVYAEGILKICELYLKSPLHCMAGVTGANLKKRIEEIMSQRGVHTLNGGKKLLLAGAGALSVLLPIVVGTVRVPVIMAQTRTQTTSAAAKFEVASVKPSHSDAPPKSNFPLGTGDVYIRNGGRFSATGFPLISYIAFAYKILGNEAQYLMPQLPNWAKTERFDIEARAEGDPGKDRMRLMMRALLADRFALAIRYEDREVPVFAFVLSRSGKTGPQLHPHLDPSPCPTEPAGSSVPNVVDGSPVFCNGIYPLPPGSPGDVRFGGRNVTMAFIANTLSALTDEGRPMVDPIAPAVYDKLSKSWPTTTSVNSKTCSPSASSSKVPSTTCKPAAASPLATAPPTRVRCIPPPCCPGPSAARPGCVRCRPANSLTSATWQKTIGAFAMLARPSSSCTGGF
jgi:bla regulator protein blaR1